MWERGNLEIVVDNVVCIVEYQVKRFKEPSERFGLGGGRISKLSLKVLGEWIANYDRGWDIYPVNALAWEAVNRLVVLYG